MASRLAFINVNRTIFAEHWLERTAGRVMAEADNGHQLASIKEVSLRARESHQRDRPREFQFMYELCRALLRDDYTLIGFSTLPGAVVHPLVMDRFKFAEMILEDPPVKDGCYILDERRESRPSRMIMQKIFGHLRKPNLTTLAVGSTIGDMELLFESTWRIAFNPMHGLRENLRDRARRPHGKDVGIITEIEDVITIQSFTHHRNRPTMTECDAREVLGTELGEYLYEQLGESTKPIFPLSR